MSGPIPSAQNAAEPEEKIKVLIVDDIPETRENLRKLLFFESDIEVVGAATNGHEGVDMAKELQPDVVLMDINMPGMDGITATETMKRSMPHIQVIIMSVQSEADYLRRSMQAGVREFLTKPFSGDELVTSVRKVYQLVQIERERMGPVVPTPVDGGGQSGTQAKPKKQGKIISLFSPKGGVGCSTLAINLAVAIHKLSSKSVIVVDASLQFGDISVLLNMHPKTTLADLAPHIDEVDTDLAERVIMSHSSGIKALLAPPRPEMADLVTPHALTETLTMLRQMYDVIIVDTYSSLQDIVIGALDMSERIVLVTTPEIPSIKSARLFFEVTDALEYPPEKTQLILNKADPRIGIRAEDIENSIKYKIEAQIPLDERAVIQAVNQGVPYVLSVPSSELTKATVNYAKKLYQSIAQPVVSS